MTQLKTDLTIREGTNSPLALQLRRFLTSLGYLQSTGNTEDQASTVDRTMLEALRRFQEFHGLVTSGTLDPETIAVMSTPRCGVPDASAKYGLGLTRWNKTTLSYRIDNTDDGLSMDEVRAAVAAAVQAWSDASGLKFTETSGGDCDIRLSFTPADHGDGSPFSGGVLAHAFPPPPNAGQLAGDVHFWNRWPWSVSDSPASGTADLTSIAIHEIGHSLGLDHSTIKDSVMYPTFSLGSTKRTLHPDDITGIRAVYSPNSKFFAKEGGLDASWVLQTEAVTSVAIAGVRTAAIRSDGRLYVKEGSIHAAWLLVSENAVACSLTSDRIGVLQSDGQVFAKEGKLDSAWTLMRDKSRAVAMSGNRVGIVDEAGRAFVKEGGLDAGWVLVFEGASQLVLAGDRVGVLGTDGNAYVKAGPLTASWVLQFRGAREIQLTSENVRRIGVVDTSGACYVKEGGLDAGWVLVADRVSTLRLAGKRIAVRGTNDDVVVKEGAIDASWVLVFQRAVGLELDGQRIGVVTQPT